MIKVVSLIKRNPNLTQEEFVHFWKTVHVPLVKERLPGLKKYIGSFPVATGPAPGSGTQELVYDAVVELGFDSLEALNAAMTGPGFSAADRVASSAKLMDLTQTRTMVVEENVVPLSK
jgi:uncharacterized protein (TIGR02118 family)